MSIGGIKWVLFVHDSSASELNGNPRIKHRHKMNRLIIFIIPYFSFAFEIFTEFW
jgi:hypothetical protein